MHAVLAQQKLKKLLALRPAPPKAKTSKIIIKVLSGNNLAAKDRNGKSDPYLTILYGTQTFKTQYVKKTLSPVWTDQVFIIAQDPRQTQILVECWDWELLGGHDFMGEFFVQTSIIPDDGSPLKKSFTLLEHTIKDKDKRKKIKGGGGISGTIELELSKAP